MPTCVRSMNFVAIDADACPACGGKAKTDLDDSIRNQQIAEAQETGDPGTALVQMLGWATFSVVAIAWTLSSFGITSLGNGLLIGFVAMVLFIGVIFAANSE